MKLWQRLLSVSRPSAPHGEVEQTTGRSKSNELPFPLNDAEKRLYDRLFAPDFSFEEGLAFYNAIVANGRQFPTEWEVRILELGLEAYPNRQDMSDRLQVLRAQVARAAQAAAHVNTRAFGSSSASGEGARSVAEARTRMEAACALPHGGVPSHGKRWGAFAALTRAAVYAFRSPVDVLHYAQTKINFEHRGNIHHEGKFTALYERELQVSFPHFAGYLDRFADIADSVPDTIYVHKGRPISNVMFYLARVIMSCLTSLPDPPRIVLEVGGGYGAPARLWMRNPIARPKCYLILDIPESLFFADVFLRSEFGLDRVHYVTSDEPVSPDVLDRFDAVLCPLPNHPALLDLPVDLVVNTGSLQEMSEDWVDFYRGWLDRQRCRWFYSLNYFAQPVDGLWESGNLLSPRVSPDWTVRLLRWNPAFVRMQADRGYLESLYEKHPSNLGAAEAAMIVGRLAQRAPCGEVFVELMDVVRCRPEPALMISVLAFAMQIRPLPKEALWLASALLSHQLDSQDRLRVEEWRALLAAKRESGTEGYH